MRDRSYGNKNNFTSFDEFVKEETVSSLFEKEKIGDEPKKGIIKYKFHVNVREEAAGDSKVVAVLKYLSKVTILEEVGSYYGIRSENGIKGYVLKSFCEEVKNE